MGHRLSTLEPTGGGEGGGDGWGGGGQTWKARLTSVVVLPCGSAVSAWVTLYALRHILQLGVGIVGARWTWVLGGPLGTVDAVVAVRARVAQVTGQVVAHVTVVTWKASEAW